MGRFDVPRAISTCSTLVQQISFDLDLERLARFDKRMIQHQFNLKASVLILLIMIGVFPTHAFAETTARVFFIANQGMISIFRPQTGGSDSDASALFDAMDVPVQDSFLGPGKSISDSTQVFSWVCANRGQPGFHCTITIRGAAGSDATTVVQDNPIRLRYEAKGALAADLSKRLKPNQPDGSFEFTNQEKTLTITSSAQASSASSAPVFSIEYRE